MGLDFYTVRFPKARKQYKCEICGGTIEKGQKHYYFSGKYDGEMYAIRDCLYCHAMVDDYCSEYGYGEYDEDEVREYLIEKYCYDCQHGMDKEDDCRHTVFDCPLIREHYKEGVTA